LSIEGGGGWTAQKKIKKRSKSLQDRGLTSITPVSERRKSPLKNTTKKPLGKGNAERSAEFSGYRGESPGGRKEKSKQGPQSGEFNKRKTNRGVGGGGKNREGSPNRESTGRKSEKAQKKVSSIDTRRRLRKKS